MLFGEKAEILETGADDWVRICTSGDQYQGWCRAGQLTVISSRAFRKKLKALSGSNTSRFIFEGSEMWVPLGADLISGKIKLGTEEGKFKGKKLKIAELTTNPDNVRNAAMFYLHAPYLWGGRTIAGIDCSGLTQMAYKLCGKQLPRDAWQQANEGILVDFLQNGQCGDLAFFDNEEGAITHVGMLLNPTTILHATGVSGRVVIDKIDPAGIISTTLRRRTHNLRLVKRYF